MAGDRKADVFAGEGSLADRLRKRRQAIEDGDPSGGNETPNPEPPPDENSADNVIARGYYIEKKRR